MAKNIGTNYTHRVTLRLNDDQYNFLIKIAELLDVTPSDYLRMVINASFVSSEGEIDNLINNALEGRVGTNENVKTDYDNQL